MEQQHNRCRQPRREHQPLGINGRKVRFATRNASKKVVRKSTHLIKHYSNFKLQKTIWSALYPFVECSQSRFRTSKLSLLGWSTNNDEFRGSPALLPIEHVIFCQQVILFFESAASTLVNSPISIQKGTEISQFLGRSDVENTCSHCIHLRVQSWYGGNWGKSRSIQEVVAFNYIWTTRKRKADIYKPLIDDIKLMVRLKHRLSSARKVPSNTYMTSVFIRE